MNTQAEVSSASAIPGESYRGICGSAKYKVIGAGPFDPECLGRSVIVHSSSGGFRCWSEEEFLRAFIRIT